MTTTVLLKRWTRSYPRTRRRPLTPTINRSPSGDRGELSRRVNRSSTGRRCRTERTTPPPCLLGQIETASDFTCLHISKRAY